MIRLRETMRYEIEIRNGRPYLAGGEDGFEVVRWFPSGGGLMTVGIAKTLLLTDENCDLGSAKSRLASLISSPGGSGAWGDLIAYPEYEKQIKP